MTIAPLYISYYATQALLFRSLMYPATKKAKVDPGSTLRKHFPAALAEFEGFTTFMTKVTPGDLASFWLRRKSNPGSMMHTCHFGTDKGVRGSVPIYSVWELPYLL